MRRDVRYRVIHDSTGGVSCWRSGPGVQLKPVRHIAFHSLDGFQYGYGGSGPADLALAILVDYLEEKPADVWRALRSFDPELRSEAYALHQDFKWRFLADPALIAPFELDAADIAPWVLEQRQAEARR